MPAKILIIDTVPTNRIVLKVKLTGANYDVQTVDTCAEAHALLEADQPDLLLINLSDPIEDRHAFCRDLRANPALANLAIVALGVADTARARFAALDAGADDVLPRPSSDVLLLARLRNLLRRRNVEDDPTFRDGMFGLEQPRTGFSGPRSIVVLSDSGPAGVGIAAKLQEGLGQPVRLIPIGGLMDDPTERALPDLFVVDATFVGLETDALYRLVAELNANRGLRSSTILVMLPRDRPELAATVLDLGADDIIPPDASRDEVTLRVKALLRQQQISEARRAHVRDGLQAAVVDPLTGLHNRRFAERQLAKIAQAAQSSGQKFALMMVDIDHFKTVNDTFGHAAGDIVLQQMAERLRNSFRSIDLIARMGGEEFLVAMPNTPLSAAHLAAERLRKLITAEPFDLGMHGPDQTLTVSVGVAVADAAEEEDGLLDSDLVTRADHALYAAKSAGRNTVSVHLSAA